MLPGMAALLMVKLHVDLIILDLDVCHLPACI